MVRNFQEITLNFRKFFTENFPSHHPDSHIDDIMLFLFDKGAVNYGIYTDSTDTVFDLLECDV